MVLYGINLVILVEDLWAVDPGILTPFYTDNTAFDGSEQRSAWLMKLLLEQGLAQGNLPDPAKYLFIQASPNQTYEM